MQRITGVTAQSSTDIINAEKYHREILSVGQRPIGHSAIVSL
jgi:hypothetical protein